MAENLSALDFYVSVALFTSLNVLAYLCERSDTQDCSKCASLSRHFVKLSHTACKAKSVNKPEGEGLGVLG